MENNYIFQNTVGPVEVIIHIVITAFIENLMLVNDFVFRNIFHSTKHSNVICI